MINPELGRLEGDHLVRVHVARILSFPSVEPADFVNLSEEDQGGMKILQWFMENRFGFNKL
jgi:epoxide hydrolase